MTDKRSLQDMPGSFLSPEGRASIEKEAMRLRDLRREEILRTEAQRGQQGRSAPASHEYTEAYSAHAAHADEGPLLSMQDTSWTPSDASPIQPVAAEKKEEPKEATFKDSDGHERCTTCKTILNRNAKVPISDAELLAYMSGSPIEKSFHIGRVGIKLRSLSQDQLDYCLYRLTIDLKNDEFPGNIHASNRQSFYQLAFSLIERGIYTQGRYQMRPEVDPNSAKDSRERESIFDSKVKELRALGHQVLLEFSRCQSALEQSIQDTLSDEQTIKNY